MKNKKLMLLPLFACLALGSCSLRSLSPGQDSTLPELAVSATAPAAPAPGSYYNGSAGMGLLLDSQGAFAMFSGGESLKGTYFLRGDLVIFACGVEEAEASLQGDGLVFSDMPGEFLPVGVAESFSALGLSRELQREYSRREDGSWLVCDYGLELSFVYPESMSAPEGLLADGAVVWDGGSAYVVGRNLGSADPAMAEDSLRGYMERQVPEDLAQLYGERGSYESMEMLEENVPGRLASAEGLMVTARERIYVKVILYTSTYSDGSVNLICKSFYAPEGDSAAFNAIANSVTDMTAVRRK